MGQSVLNLFAAPTPKERKKSFVDLEGGQAGYSRDRMNSMIPMDDDPEIQDESCEKLRRPSYNNVFWSPRQSGVPSWLDRGLPKASELDQLVRQNVRNKQSHVAGKLPAGHNAPPSVPRSVFSVQQKGLKQSAYPSRPRGLSRTRRVPNRGAAQRQMNEIQVLVRARRMSTKHVPTVH